jgi:hypothetical protein
VLLLLLLPADSVTHPRRNTDGIDTTDFHALSEPSQKDHNGRFRWSDAQMTAASFHTQHPTSRIKLNETGS